MLFYLKFFYMILCIGSNLVIIATHFRHNHHGRVKARSVSSDITKLPNDYRNSSSRVAIFDAKNHRRSARSMPASNENLNLSMYNFDKISVILFLETYLCFKATFDSCAFEFWPRFRFEKNRKRFFWYLFTLFHFQNITDRVANNFELKGAHNFFFTLKMTFLLHFYASIFWRKAHIVRLGAHY